MLKVLKASCASQSLVSAEPSNAVLLAIHPRWVLPHIRNLQPAVWVESGDEEVPTARVGDCIDSVALCSKGSTADPPLHRGRKKEGSLVKMSACIWHRPILIRPSFAQATASSVSRLVATLRRFPGYIAGEATCPGGILHAWWVVLPVLVCVLGGVL